LINGSIIRFFEGHAWAFQLAKHVAAMLFALPAFLLFTASPSAAPLRKNLAALPAKDTICKVWVIFTDKNPSTGTGAVSPRALARRRRAGVRNPGATDVPVAETYLREVERLGARRANIFKWANAASFTVASPKLDAIANLTCVRDLILVRSFVNTTPAPAVRGLGKAAVFKGDSIYGLALPQLAMLNVPPAHRLIHAKGPAAPGDGILIGMFDSGFRLQHRCFSYLNAHNLVVADSDFIDHKNTVFDPESVADNPASAYYQNDEHGSCTLATIAGYDPPQFMGVAWGAHFVLARTEDSPVEKHYEEDNWAAAMVWAESLGVDIVNSSLGYSDGFSPPDTDYTYQDMNGVTTIVSKAATMATQFGVVVVNAMGNDGPAAGSLAAPADVKGVVSAGAVDGSLSVADFSGRGPTSDGRIKPDCVALGVGACVPQVYGGNNTAYTYEDGTSFSSPLTAGVCALVLQAHAGDSAGAVRNRLYSSCFFVPGQTAANNASGRGVPDALLACLADNQTYVTVADSFGRSVAGAVLATKAGVQAGITDSAGYAIVNLDGSFPETLSVSNPLFLPRSVIVASRHSRDTVVLASRFIVSVSMRDSLDSAVVTGTLFWRQLGDSAYVSQQADSTGAVLITSIETPPVELYGVAAGYFNSSRIAVNPSGNGTTFTTLLLRPRPASQFVIFPNVLDIGAKRQQLTLQFTASQDDPRSYSQLFTAAIRSIDGALVWQFSKVLEALKPVVLQWPDPGRTVVPGVYFFIVKYGGKTYRRKFMVIG
jgi:hypothetical protein